MTKPISSNINCDTPAGCAEPFANRQRIVSGTPDQPDKQIWVDLNGDGRFAELMVVAKGEFKSVVARTPAKPISIDDPKRSSQWEILFKDIPIQSSLELIGAGDYDNDGIFDVSIVVDGKVLINEPGQVTPSVDGRL